MELSQPPLPAEVRRIILLWIGRLGDFIITTPVLRSIRARFPKARILLVAGQGAYEAARLCPDVDEARALGRFTSPLANLSLATELITHRADLLIDLNTAFSRASAALAVASRARLKMAFVKKSANQVYHYHLAMPAETEPMLDRYGRLAKALGAPYDPRPHLPVSAADAGRAKNILDGLAGAAAAAQTRRIAIHPGNFRKFDNRWPEEKFIELTNRLLDLENLQLLCMAGPGEQSRVGALVSSLKRPLPILPPMPLGLTAAALSNLDLLIASVTGTAHLAVAVGTPTFSFRSRYTDTVWMPPLAPPSGYPTPLSASGTTGEDALPCPWYSRSAARAGSATFPAAPHYGIVSESWTSCRDISVPDAWDKLAEVLKNLPRRRVGLGQ